MHMVYDVRIGGESPDLRVGAPDEDHDAVQGRHVRFEQVSSAGVNYATEEYFEQDFVEISMAVGWFRWVPMSASVKVSFDSRLHFLGT